MPRNSYQTLRIESRTRIRRKRKKVYHKVKRINKGKLFDVVVNHLKTRRVPNWSNRDYVTTQVVAKELGTRVADVQRVFQRLIGKGVMSRDKHMWAPHERYENGSSAWSATTYTINRKKLEET